MPRFALLVFTLGFLRHHGTSPSGIAGASGTMNAFMFARIGAVVVVLMGHFGCATAQQAQTAEAAAPRSEPSEAFAAGREALSRMSGCYIVDYNFSETRALSPDYVRDERIYDVNDDKTVMEWIFPIESGNTLRLQHVLFSLDQQGRFNPESLLRHQAEDWQYAPASYFDYQGGLRWTKVKVTEPDGKWLRKITALDDGLRYQCVGAWQQKGKRLEWECGDNYAPIPGRETRDMGRKDYQGLLRSTHLVVFPVHWVERQNNVKTVEQGTERKPLAEEVGRNWFLQVPDENCSAIQRYVAERKAWWRLLQETWEELYAREEGFAESKPENGPPRFARINEIEERYYSRVENDEQARSAAKKEILEVIDAYRAK